MYDEDKELAKGHDATWDDAVTCVQKTFTASDLPAKFEIDCPTPKGKYPVYPRMVFVRREVLAPGQSPAALPAPPSTPAVGPERRAGDAAQSLDDRHATAAGGAGSGRRRRAVLPVKKVAYVSKKGEVFKHQFVKWLKDNSDAWIMLVDFDAAKLPKRGRRWPSAKLVLYVEEAHDKAPMQVAAVMLDAPFEPEQPYDFAKLGQTRGLDRRRRRARGDARSRRRGATRST